MTLTDTHCHLDLDRFDADRQAVLERAVEAGVQRILIPSLDLDSAARVVTLAASHPTLFAGVGVHPTNISVARGTWLETLRELARHPNVVAIGEIGLDYYWVHEPVLRVRQQEALQRQLSLAAELGTPVVIHMREERDEKVGAAAEDLLGLLESWVTEVRSSASPLLGRCGVLHSFAGTLETAHKAIELGFYIGITGPITYPRADSRRELVRALPLERLLIETDAPFLAPQRHRGRRNEPAFVVDIADRIAEVRSQTSGEVARATSSNAARLFAWGDPD